MVILVLLNLDPWYKITFGIVNDGYGFYNVREKNKGSKKGISIYMCLYSSLR